MPPGCLQPTLLPAQAAGREASYDRRMPSEPDTPHTDTGAAALRSRVVQHKALCLKRYLRVTEVHQQEVTAK